MASNLAYMIFGIIVGFMLACLAFTIAAQHFGRRPEGGEGE